MNSRTIVILAAGTGSRIESIRKEKPKPLIKLGGLSLIERAIRSAQRRGFTKFVVVVGFQAEDIRNELKDGSQWGVEIQYAQNDQWDKKNGISVLSAKPFVTTDEFVLLMSDHVLDQAFFDKINQTKLEHDLLLMTDSKLNEIFDMDDATKVETDGTYILNIGKAIPKYQTVDTGVFICKTSFFNILEEFYSKNGDVSLSEGVNLLVSQKRAVIQDIGDMWWQDVDAKPAYKHAEKLMLKKQIKKTDVWVSRYCNRPISLFFSKYLVRTPITPNQTSFIGFFAGLMAPVFLVWGNYWGFMLGAFCYHMSSVLDGCDGEIARMKMMESEGGEWMDTLTDTISHFLFLSGMVYGLVKVTGETWPITLGVISLVSIVLLVLVMFKFIRGENRGTLIAFDQAFEKSVTKDQNIFARMALFFKPIMRRANFAFLFFLLALIGKISWVLFLICVGPLVTLILILITFRSKIFGTKQTVS
jgi:choline kinase/phosphatidylglycerophosphate synthase